MNVLCKINEVRDHLADNTGFYDFVNATDSTGALEHIYRFSVKYDTNIAFPFAVITPGRHESVFESNCHTNFRTEILVEFIDSYSYYNDDDGNRYSEEEALCIFTEKIDNILRESKRLFYRNITGFSINVAPYIEDEFVEEQPLGRLMKCEISYSFEPGGN